MTTEIRPGKRRTSENNSAGIRGWRHLHALAEMEGRPMLIAAAHRVRGHLTESERTAIAFTGIEFVRAGYSNRPALNISCRVIAARVEQLALQIDEGEWVWALDYESAAWQRAHPVDETAEENVFFRGGRISAIAPVQQICRPECVCPGGCFRKALFQYY